jgi:hypothetical protein
MIIPLLFASILVTLSGYYVTLPAKSTNDMEHREIGKTLEIAGDFAGHRSGRMSSTNASKVNRVILLAI